MNCSIQNQNIGFPLFQNITIHLDWQGYFRNPRTLTAAPSFFCRYIFLLYRISLIVRSYNFSTSSIFPDFTDINFRENFRKIRIHLKIYIRFGISKFHRKLCIPCGDLIDNLVLKNGFIKNIVLNAMVR